MGKRGPNEHQKRWCKNCERITAHTSDTPRGDPVEKSRWEDVELCGRKVPGYLTRVYCKECTYSICDSVFYDIDEREINLCQKEFEKIQAMNTTLESKIKNLGEENKRLRKVISEAAMILKKVEDK